MGKIFILILTSSLFLTSCKKNFGYYQEGTPTADTTITKTNSGYVDGGVLDNGNNTPTPNGFSGTKWIVLKYNNGFANTYPNDTIYFISNSEYHLNSFGIRTYNVSDIAGSTNKSLSMNFFSTLGGSNYSAQIGAYFASDGVINNAEFLDYQDNSKKYKVWLKKL